MTMIIICLIVFAISLGWFFYDLHVETKKFILLAEQERCEGLIEDEEDE
jgi:hypothetical protein